MRLLYCCTFKSVFLCSTLPHSAYILRLFLESCDSQHPLSIMLPALSLYCSHSPIIWLPCVSFRPSHIIFALAKLPLTDKNRQMFGLIMLQNESCVGKIYPYYLSHVSTVCHFIVWLSISKAFTLDKVGGVEKIFDNACVHRLYYSDTRARVFCIVPYFPMTQGLMFILIAVYRLYLLVLRSKVHMRLVLFCPLHHDYFTSLFSGLVLDKENHEYFRLVLVNKKKHLFILVISRFVDKNRVNILV